MKKSKKNKNVIWFWDEIYCIQYLVIITPSYKKYKELMLKLINHKCEDESDDCSGCFTVIPNKKMGNLAVIWSSDKTNSLVHECLHSTSYAMHSKDIVMDSESSEECYCYYLSYLFRTIQERLNQ